MRARQSRFILSKTMAGRGRCFGGGGEVLAGRGGSSVTLLWRDNDTNETSFTLERNLGNLGPWIQIAVLSSNLTSYVDGSVEAGTNYAYRLRSWNGAGA